MKAKRVRKLDPLGPLIDNAARIVRTRLDELRSLAPSALRPESASDQHDLRIAAKRLRYVLENTGFCFGEDAETARRAAKELQGVLGELHDCDVMAPRVAAHVERLRAEDAAAIRRRAIGPDLDPGLAAESPNRAAYLGLGTFQVHLEARRGVLFDRFAARWRELERERTWERLEDAIERRVRAGRQRREAAVRAEAAALELERAERDERDAAERARRAATALADARRARGANDRSA